MQPTEIALFGIRTRDPLNYIGLQSSVRLQKFRHSHSHTCLSYLLLQLIIVRRVWICAAYDAFKTQALSKKPANRRRWLTGGPASQLTSSACRRSARNLFQWQDSQSLALLLRGRCPYVISVDLQRSQPRSRHASRMLPVFGDLWSLGSFRWPSALPCKAKRQYLLTL